MNFSKNTNRPDEKNESISDNTRIISSMFDEEFCEINESGVSLEKILDESIDIKEKLIIFRIPNPALNQKPSKIYLTVVECCKLIGISIHEYLFIDNNMCSLKPISKSNGKLFFKVSTVISIITTTEIWFLNHSENSSIEIIYKLLFIYGYYRISDINTPSTKISFCDLNSNEFTSPYYYNSKTNLSIEYNSHDKPEVSSKDLSINSQSEFDLFEGTQYYFTKDCSKNIQTEFLLCVKNEGENSQMNESIRKSNLCSLSFTGTCIDIILETVYLDIIRSINSTKNEAVNCFNGLIKSSKWYKYPWRFTFNDFTKKKLISKSVSGIEANISVLKESLTKLIEEMKFSQDDRDYVPIISVEEWEKILNKYIPVIYRASKELKEIKTSITFSDELSRVYLDFQRNEYMYTNLKISLLTLSCSVTSVITG
ncbi:hypothetical protein RS030_213434 [Cryptosporidium xiaoi]|uniref:Uncharacterized protein n=1 Tax=Cryptosporidium xiaoi TaxID=659607 RepID=A0AAV9XXI9_9CRYT